MQSVSKNIDRKKDGNELLASHTFVSGDEHTRTCMSGRKKITVKMIHKDKAKGTRLVLPCLATSLLNKTRRQKQSYKYISGLLNKSFG